MLVLSCRTSSKKSPIEREDWALEHEKIRDLKQLLTRGGIFLNEGEKMKHFVLLNTLSGKKICESNHVVEGQT